MVKDSKYVYSAPRHAFGSVKKLYGSDNGEDTGVLDINDQVVADLGHNVTQGLGKDDIHHCLDMSPFRWPWRPLSVPSSIERIPPLTVSAIYAPVLMETIRMAAKPHGHIDLEQIGTSVNR